MSDDPSTPDRIAELLVHLGRAAQSADAQSQLTAAQWTCLRFFARANGSTRTPSAFASFQSTTRGTASQIIKSLERRDLLARTRSDRDRRSVCFDLTDAGRTMLGHDPLREIVTLIAALGAVERARFLDTLSALASALAMQRDVPCFGTCRDCSHFGTSSGSGGGAYCACMAAELAADEISKLCASYTPGPAAGPEPGEDEERDGAS